MSSEDVYRNGELLLRPFIEAVNRRYTNPLDATRHFLKVANLVGYYGSLVLYFLLEKECIIKDREAYKEVLDRLKSPDEHKHDEYIQIYLPTIPTRFEDGFFSMPLKLMEKGIGARRNIIERGITNLLHYDLINTTKRGRPNVTCFKINHHDLLQFLMEDTPEDHHGN